MEYSARIIDYSQMRSSAHASVRSQSRSSASSRRAASSRGLDSSRRADSSRNSVSSRRSDSPRRSLGSHARSAQSRADYASSRTNSRTNSRVSSRTNNRADAAQSRAAASSYQPGAAEPRAAVTSGEASESSRNDSLSSRIERSQHDRRKRRADKQFDRTVAQSTEEESGTRAAVHRGAMGSRQRRASRMHAEASPYKNPAQMAVGGLAGIKNALVDLGSSLTHGGIFNIKLIAVVCMLLLCVCVYGPAKNYYTATRDLAKNQVEYAALQDYRDELQSEVSAMDTDEGVEDAVRSRYGWVKSTETGLVVSDAKAQDDFDATDIGIVPDGAISAPKTWYSGFLDFFFGYKG